MKLVVCVSSAATNLKRRRAIRRSWFAFKTGPNSWLSEQEQASITLLFVVSSGTEALEAEQAEHGDMLILDAPEGYEHLWRKALVSLQVLEQRYQYDYYMHADDDSYVRLDLITKLLLDAPKQRFYWGYIWDGTGNRCTAPIRNSNNKSHMPAEQYALDYYPPFASGCGFILSRDLVQALVKEPLPDYRLLDPPFGIHLCGKDLCVLPEGPVTPVHDPCVRPYRGIPIFKPTTIVQHYLTAEEMGPFHAQVLEHLSKQGTGGTNSLGQTLPQESSSAEHGAGSQESSADALYQQLVNLGLLQR